MRYSKELYEEEWKGEGNIITLKQVKKCTIR